MKKIFPIIYMIFIIITIPFIIQANPPSSVDETQPKPLILKTLLKEAITRNPKIRAAEKEITASSYRIKPAQTLPDPMIELGIKNMGLSEWMIGTDPTSGIGISISQLIPFFGKLRIQGELSRKEFEFKQLKLEEIKQEVFRQVKQYYFDLYYLHKAVYIYQKQKELVEKALTLTETRYSVGRGTQGDIFKAQLEISRMDEMIIPMTQMIKAKESSLNLLLDYPPHLPVGIPEQIDFSTFPLSLEQLEETLIMRSPVLKEAEKNTETKEKEIEMAKKNFYPDFRVKAGWEYKGKLTDMYEFMVGMEIPIFAKRKQSLRLKETNAMTEGSYLEKTSIKNELLMSLNDFFIKAKTAENLIRLYKTQIIPQSKLALEASFAAYPVDKTDFMSLLEDISNQFAAELALFRELNQLWNATANIEAVTTINIFPNVMDIEEPSNVSHSISTTDETKKE